MKKLKNNEIENNKETEIMPYSSEVDYAAFSEVLGKNRVTES